MKRRNRFLLFSAMPAYVFADDVDCVRNNCLGTCVSKQEALGKPIPMICKANYVCYQDIECAKGDNGKCGWQETPQLKACLAEKMKETQPQLPALKSLP